ncbi:hypothetical protein CANINC_002500 [Pichia inconspicua]|uniref:Thioredoxin domain-containing protein n=1 Tax=Pichia inconspicua TaxID=52247 RepID=A0A4T0X1A3_9ASCO|nr:hypothetical protein CANINC_002500 [[Candida] inconspicua]
MSQPTTKTLRLGSTAPNFTSDTSIGELTFYDYVGPDHWCVLFSHPDDFTPVCTTELGAFARLSPEFERRNCKMIGLSANDANAHRRWIKDITEITGSNVEFPIIADPNRNVALLYDMLDFEDARNIDDNGVQLTIRSVFIIDPNKIIRLIMSYPASCGRNTAEVLRALDALQTSHKLNKTIATPINWVPGDDVIVAASLDDSSAKTLFPKFRAIKPYLRLTPLPKDDEWSPEQQALANHCRDQTSHPAA